MSMTRTWKPDDAKLKEIQDEIENSFDKGVKSDLTNPVISTGSDDGRVPAIRPDSAFIDDCARIAVFLSDTEAVLVQLKRLNELIADKIPSGSSPRVKVLRETLEEELSKFGFIPKFGKALDQLEADEFRATLSHGLVLKDVGLGASMHGEFSHAIQWLMIAWQQQATSFLKSAVIDIYKKLGDEQSVYLRAAWHSINEVPGEKNIWDLIVDRVVDNEILNPNKYDFRSPEDLSRFITGSKDKELNLLKQFINDRIEKRRRDYRGQKIAIKADAKLQTPGTLYHKSEIPNVHEPVGTKIDLKGFRKKK